MKRVTLLFLLFGWMQVLIAAPSSDTLKIKAILVAEDDWNRLYVIDNENQLLRFSDSLKIQAIYSNKRSGYFSLIDVSNPFRILLYSGETQSGIVLDNALNELFPFSLLRWGFQRVEAMAVSNDNNFWAFDQINNRLLKINSEGKEIAQSNPLTPDLEAPFEPIRLLERNNQVFLFLKNKGIVMFDNFGMYQSFFPVEELEDGDYRNGYFWLKPNEKAWYAMEAKSWKTILAPSEFSKEDRILWGSKIYWTKQDEIVICPFPK